MELPTSLSWFVTPAPGTVPLSSASTMLALVTRFWRALAEVGLTSRELLPAEYGQLLGFGIGLADLTKGQAGSDDELRFARADAMALRAKIILYQPRYLCFNAKRGTREFLHLPQVAYGVQAERIIRTVLFIAPSTSRAANAS